MIRIACLLLLVAIGLLGCRRQVDHQMPSDIPYVDRVGRSELPTGLLSDRTLADANMGVPLEYRARWFQFSLADDAKSWTEADFKRFLEDVLRRPELWADLGLGFNADAREEINRLDIADGTEVAVDLVRRTDGHGGAFWSARVTVEESDREQYFSLGVGWLSVDWERNPITHPRP